jgi:hypothetical protein
MQWPVVVGLDPAMALSMALRELAYAKPVELLY